MVLLISYDLNGKERPEAYEVVRKAIEQKATAAIRPLYSQWFVKTSETPEAWSDYLAKVIDKNDSLFVCQVTPPYQGWLEQSAWDFLK